MEGLTSPPPPSKVTAAPDMKEDPVAVVINGLRLGTSTEAGAECITSRSTRGIDGELYRFYVRTLGAPGPYLVRDPITKKYVPARDEQGRELFDLDAVAEWNSNRPGPGARSAGRPLKHTDVRLDLMAAARDGRLELDRVSGRPFLTSDGQLHETTVKTLGMKETATPPAGQPLELRSRSLQLLRELITAGILADPRGASGKYRVTPAGERWLDEHARATCTT